VGLVGPEDLMFPLEEKNDSCPCLESKSISSVLQSVAWTAYQQS
jgi:hypothetical protein